ncbi:transporter substrate-binding protein [Planctomicrobium sp. SH664]|uniref:transporter substrate-binding protein n=1 Tax=Planctomicrobium sp. SH664 TaxID=3448125 RepID=UPI003F5B4739
MTSSDANRLDLTDGGREDGLPTLAETRIMGGEDESHRPRPNLSAEGWVGRKIGKYQITGILGMGGMGIVLRGHDEGIDRDVAVKVLPEELASDEVALNRFLSEARSAGKLHHPHTVTIYEIGKEGNIHYLAMEIVAGGSAADELRRRGPYSVGEATRLTIEACMGLHAAHKQGIIHRDIKPANLLLTPEKMVKVSDFGLAKRVQSSGLNATQAGQIVGTPYFMSPEQCESRKIDARSDIYSLGATYYSLLTARSPYQESDSVVQVMYAHCHAARPDPREVSALIPLACAMIIERAMATDVQLRYQNMEELRRDLEAVLAALSGAGIVLPSQDRTQRIDRPLPALPAERRTWLWGAVAGGVLVATALIAGLATLLSARGTPGSVAAANEQAATPPVAAVAPAAAVVPLIPPPVGPPLRVGILHSLTGSMANSESPVVDATLLAIEQLNQRGGVLGRPVEGIVADGKSDPDVFAEEAARLIEKEDVCTVFGCWTSASRKTVIPVFEQANHLLLYPVQYEGAEESPYVVYTGAAPNQQIIPAIKWAYAFLGKRKFYVVGSDYVFPRVAAEIIKDQLAELGGQLVGEDFIPLGGLDVHDVVGRIQAAQPDVILNLINGDTNTIFFNELRRAGLTPQSVPTISFSVGEEELRRLRVASMAGDFAVWNYFQSIDSQENKEFIAAFRKRYGPQRVVNDPMEAAYFGVFLWARGVEAARSLVPADIRLGIRGQEVKAPEGRVKIDPQTQHTFKTPRIGRVQPDGQFLIVWTAAEPEAPVPFPPTRSREEWEQLLQKLYRGWGNHWSLQTQ